MIDTTLLAAGLLLTSVATGHGAWWTVLSVIAIRPPRMNLPVPDRAPAFVVVVPAHNEERLITRCVRSLQRAAKRYPGQVEVLVVADNCTDATAANARSAGATVLERVNPGLRGKSHALEFSLETLRTRPVGPDAVAFVDGDSEVSDTFFLALAHRLGQGAGVVQVHYAAGPGDEPIRRLRRLAFGLVHWSRALGAARLGLGTSLKGNGMAYRWDLARDGLGGHGITEDAAMTLALARRGVAVVFEPSATVWGHMASTFAEARTQDRRWEQGRSRLLPASLMATLGAATRGRFSAAAGAAEVASLPLSLVATAGIAGAGLILVVNPASVWLAAIGLVSPVAYVAAGLVAARPARRDIQALVWAPRMYAHKLRTLAWAAVQRGEPAWLRTARSDTRD